MTVLTRRADAPFAPTQLGIGTARTGAFWQGRGVREGEAALRLAIDLGVALIDTADCYARGIAERLVGRAVQGSDDVVVMTKVGLLKTPVAQRAAHAAGHSPTGEGLRPEQVADRCYRSGYIRHAAHRCLRRQRRDRLDVLLLHEPSAEELARGEHCQAIEEMLSAGDVLGWGASVRTADAAVEALHDPTLSVLQIPVSAEDPHILEATRRAIGGRPTSARPVTVVALAVLGDGQLLRRATASGAAADDAVAVLLGYAAGLPGVDAALLGMSTRDHVRHNLAALCRGVDEDVVAAVLSAVRSTGGVGGLAS